MVEKIILPGSTVGILGGGQLGRMMAIEAKKMGYDVICLDPTPDSPCGQVADYQIVAPLDDLEAALKLAERSDVVVYEFENIDVRLVEELEKKYNLPQGSRILSIAQDRIQEKTEMQKAGFPVVPFQVVRNQDNLEKGVTELGYPCVLKTARGGYDGKGQLVLKSPQDLGEATEMLQVPGMEWVLEKMITFTHEASAIVARNQKGEIAVFPVAENIHRDNILFMSIVPPRIGPEMEKEAARIAKEMAQAFDLVGLLAIEFFVTPEGLLVNEIAPRPHNSGHYTWDGCYVSQFEQIIRAVCGLPLGTTELVSPVMMVNILGADMDAVLNELPKFADNVKLHLYGKRGTPEAKRKMGHLSVKTDQPEEAIAWVKSFY
ncbi:MAG: 5-(carboxyamino)imidazole ribonucleotide synthase [Thermincolia bacterium]